MPMTSPRPRELWLDWLAIGASGLCLVHCLALPLLIASLPSLGAFAGGGQTHWILLAFAVPVSVWALGRRRGAAGFTALIVGGIGLALMAVGVARFEGLAEERWLTVAGVVLVAVAHTIRWRGRRHGHARPHA